VAEIGVDIEDMVIPMLDGIFHAGHNGGPQTQLSAAMQAVHAIVFGRLSIAPGPGAVG
jgi:hypothetical protein